MLIDKHLIEDYMESEINSSKIHRLIDKLIEMENEMMKELNDKQKDTKKSPKWGKLAEQ